MPPPLEFPTCLLLPAIVETTPPGTNIPDLGSRRVGSMAGGAQENLTGGDTDQQKLFMIQVVMGQLMKEGGNSTTTVLEHPGSAMWRGRAW